MRNASCVFLALVCLAIGSLPVHAQSTADLLTLDRAIELALASNRTLRGAALDQQKQADEVAALRTRRFPALDLKVFEGAFLSPVEFTFRQGAFGTFPATGPIPLADLSVDSPRRISTAVLFTAVQPLTQLRKIARGESLLKLGGDLVDEKTREQRQQLIGDVRRAYYALQQAAAGRTALGQVGSQLEELDRVVGEYLNRQVALPADHLAVRTERARIDREVLVLRNLQATLTERINLLIGRDLSTPFAIEPLAGAAMDPRSVDAAVARARASRPAIRQAELNVRRASADAELHALDRLPDVSVALGMLRLANVDVLPRNVAAASLVLTWEPFDWGRRRQEGTARSRTLEQARRGVAEAQALVELDVRRKARAVAEANAAVEVARLGRDAAAERLRVATDRYTVEAALLKDLLESQTAMAQAIQAYQQALGNFWTARADFDQAVGDQP
ncbi:MAG: TolC family protein [Acidobacteriota bacterium]